MIEAVFTILVGIAGAYVTVGLAVAVLFFTRWLKTFDPAAVGGSREFRVLVTPGIVLLWPLIVMKVFYPNSGGNPDGAEALRRIHRLAFIVLAIAVTLVFTAALVWRAPAFTDLPQIESPAP